MKAYYLIVQIIDHDQLGYDEIKNVIETTKYPNWCISPRVVSGLEKEIGEWSDEHPLNSTHHKPHIQFDGIFGVAVDDKKDMIHGRE